MSHLAHWLIWLTGDGIRSMHGFKTVIAAAVLVQLSSNFFYFVISKTFNSVI